MLDGCSKPLPQPRSILRKSGPVEDNEGKTRSRKGLYSFSSSLTTLNTQAVPTKKLIVESPGPEVRECSFSSPPPPQSAVDIFETNFCLADKIFWKKKCEKMCLPVAFLL